jgi:uncharacterized protein (DUF983 family)
MLACHNAQPRSAPAGCRSKIQAAAPQQGKPAMTTLITGIIGIVMLMTFLGVMLWWVKALPLIVIIVFVILLMLYDFVQTLRFGDNYGANGE